MEKLYRRETGFEESLNNIERSLEQLKAEEEALTMTNKLHEDLTASIIGDMLMEISNIARIRNIPQEQVLSDRLDDRIDSAEAKAYRSEL